MGIFNVNHRVVKDARFYIPFHAIRVAFQCLRVKAHEIPVAQAKIREGQTRTQTSHSSNRGK